jgi:hypothetical protein
MGVMAVKAVQHVLLDMGAVLEPADLSRMAPVADIDIRHLDEQSVTPSVGDMKRTGSVALLTALLKEGVMAFQVFPLVHRKFTVMAGQAGVRADVTRLLATEHPHGNDHSKATEARKRSLAPPDFVFPDGVNHRLNPPCGQMPRRRTQISFNPHST